MPLGMRIDDLAQFGFVSGGEDDAGAFPGKRERGLQPDAAGGTGDDDDLILKTSAHSEIDFSSQQNKPWYMGNGWIDNA